MRNLFIVLFSLMATSYSHADEILRDNTQTDAPNVTESRIVSLKYGGVETRLSGFVAGTFFTDKTWYPDVKTAALNIDVTYDEWAVRAQVAAPYSQPIRRAVVERSFFILPYHEFLVQVGRFPRLSSFYNDVTDSPGTSGLAMLPPGEYNRRLLKNRTFNGIEGIQGIYTWNSPIGMFKLHADYGRMVVEDQCNTQKEASKLPCRPGYEIEGTKGNYDIGVSFDKGPWAVLVYHGDLLAKTNLLNPKDPTSVFIANRANRIQYTADKIGIRFDNCKWLLQSEFMRNKFNLAKPNQAFTSTQTSWNVYGLAGWYWSDEFLTYAEYSHGKSNTGGLAIDRAIGATYVFNNTTVSLEKHRGEGYAWKDYFSSKPTWNSWVLSITQRF